MTVDALPLEPEDVAFMQAGVSIIAAARDGNNETTISRAIGCRISADHQRVTIFLSAARSGALLADIRANGMIAVVFSRPTSLRTIQLKGNDAAVVPPLADDPHLWAAYRRHMTAEVQRVGFSEAFTRALLDAPAEDIVAVEFTPSSAFLQTPGPKAGTPLQTRA
jgi:hypothetical protein